GDPVKQGQVIAILEPLPMDVRAIEEATARLQAAQARAIEAGQRTRRAQADLQFASNERARIDRLAREGFISPQAIDKASSAEAAARAEWNAARSGEQAASADAKAAEAALLSANLASNMKRSQLRLTTPVDGYILKIHEKSERTVSAGMPLATIGDPARYEIVVDVLSTDAVKVTRGDPMLLERWGGGKTLEARVRLVEPVAFTKISALGVEEQRVNVIVDPVDSLGALGDGYRVEARIVIWSGERVTKVPGSSVFRAGQAWHVFTVEGGRAREREVGVGQRNQDEVQILSGMEVGATVIRYPDNQIEDGARVRPISSR
ncbi:MAG: efflux RND transporter periplasmic adaptor subunit, partial [Noviherbaspirillum sp.]